MTFEELTSGLKSIITQTTGIPEYQIVDGVKIPGDSLDYVEILMKLEKHLDFTISDDVAEKFISGDAIFFDKIISVLIENYPRELIEIIDLRILSFSFTEKNRIQVKLKKEDGSWLYADGMVELPSNLCFLTYSRWGNILKELEELINSPETLESDLQKYFERYPELLAGKDYEVIIPQAVIETESNKWKSDFILIPHNQVEFSKILELKLPSVPIIKRPNSGHYNFSANLYNAIQQIKDYSRAFKSTEVQKRFQQKYNLEVFEPDLHLIVGRKWDLQLNEEHKKLIRESQVKIEDWDSVVERLKRNFTI